MDAATSKLTWAQAWQMVQVVQVSMGTWRMSLGTCGVVFLGQRPGPMQRAAFLRSLGYAN